MTLIRPGILKGIVTASFAGVVDLGSKTGAFSIDWNAGQLQKVTLTGNVTLTFVNPPGPGHYQVLVTQDAGGTNTWAHPAATRASGSVAPIFSLGANEQTLFTYDFDGTLYLVASVSAIGTIV